AAQTDFTSTGELAITVAGVLYVHLLGVFVLPFSNWMWLTVSLSESMLAIKRTVQRALFQLGHVPTFHQTDNSTAATHRIAKAGADPARPRPFNEEYEALMRHYGMTPRTIAIGESHQNGDVEAANGALKRALEQALLVRGYRDFDSTEHYQKFLDGFSRQRNQSRGTRVEHELAAMRPLQVESLTEFLEVRVRVTCWGTVCVRKNTYSVPTRLIGQELRVRLYEERLEFWFGSRCELRCERLRGESKKRIDYRHLVWSLLRKPGGFERYVYREEMFPTRLFRETFDALGASKQDVDRDVEYLRILHLAASTMQSDVEAALELLNAQGEGITADKVKALVEARRPSTAPALLPMKPDLHAYDALLTGVTS
ncbi:MAG: transposase family protein, partial [Cytophagaceae bacterium]|nr:transposase family protein [Gemmatimonadaceae bacterium]